MELLIPNFLGKEPKKELEMVLKKLKLKKDAVRKYYFANNALLLELDIKKISPLELKRLSQYSACSLEEKEEIKRVHQYIEHFKRLIELEKQAEIATQKEEIKRLSGKERELLGKAILDLKGSRVGTKFKMHFVKFGRKRLIETEISPGDIVLVSRGEPLKSDLIGTVVKVTSRSILVAFENAPPSWVYKEGIRIDLYANEITFRRMIENLEALRNATGRLKELRNILLGIKEPSQVKEEVEISEFFNKKLNDTQKTAVKLALGAKDFFLIHGPPGTGKTVTLTELILQLVKQGYKVIATADSNIAVDNLLLNLSQYSLKLVRIGHPARIMEELERFSLYALFEQDELSNQIKEKWEQVQLLIKKRDKFIKPVPSLKRGLSEEEIIELAKKKKGTRGIKKETIISMANWIKLNREIEEQINNIKNLEMQVFKKIISQADVVLSTNSMAKSEFLEDFVFDVAVIDEGSQQVEPSTLIPIVKAKRFFIAGDHKQLPPTILSEKAKKDLEKTLFEKLIERHPNLSIMLKVQYRMNEKIMKFPNEEFYEGKLVSAEEVKDKLLADFDVKVPTIFKEVLSPYKALGFIDTSHIDAFEHQSMGSTSYENVKEAEICIKVVEELLKMGVKHEWIGIITPYKAQVKLLRKLFKERKIKIEINTVDGFQGREKEVIIISWVRANKNKEIGFLEDLRRLNVSITRAKKKLICIGHSETLFSHPVYKKFLNYIKAEGSWEKVELL